MPFSSRIKNQIPQGPGGAVAAALVRGQSCCMQIIGDSTGDASNEWFSLIGQRLGLRHPEYNVAFRSWNDATQWYDPVTYLQTAAAGERYATLAAAQLQYTASSITGDIEVVVKARATNWLTLTQILAAKYDTTSNQRGWNFGLNSTGKLSVTWSPDGTSASALTKVSTASVPFANGSAGWVKFTLDVDNGASGNSIKFYTSPDGIVWTQLGTTVTTATATSIFDNSTIPYSVGLYGTGSSGGWAGDVFWVEIKNGIGGYSVVPPLLESWYQYTVFTADPVLYGGAPTLLLVDGSFSGQAIAYFDDSTRKGRLASPHGQSLLFTSTGHNESNALAYVWVARYSAWVTDLKTLLPGVPIVPVTQNPVKPPYGTNNASLRANRGITLMAWASSQAGLWPIDTYPAFTDLANQIDSGGVHPTHEGDAGVRSPSGSKVWADYVFEALFD